MTVERVLVAVGAELVILLGLLFASRRHPETFQRVRPWALAGLLIVGMILLIDSVS
jgi:hypothetical protein